jgi:hypothetical protein
MRRTLARYFIPILNLILEGGKRNEDATSAGYGRSRLRRKSYLQGTEDGRVLSEEERNWASAAADPFSFVDA